MICWKGINMKKHLSEHQDDLWISFFPHTEKGRSLIREYIGKNHEWYKKLAVSVGYDGGITFPHNRVNKFTTYVNVRLRKENENI